MLRRFCIAGPFIWNLIKRAPNRVVAAVPAQPVGFRPELPNALYESQTTGWGAQLVKRRPHITSEMADRFLNRMFRNQLSMYPWKDTPEKIPLAVRHVRSFLLSHRPA